MTFAIASQWLIFALVVGVVLGLLAVLTKVRG